MIPEIVFGIDPYRLTRVPFNSLIRKMVPELNEKPEKFDFQFINVEFFFGKAILEHKRVEVNVLKPWNDIPESPKICYMG